MEFDKTQEPPIFKADFDRVMLEMKQQQDEASEQRKEMKRVLEELIASRAEVARLQMASKQTQERVQVDVHYQHVLKEMLSTKEEAKRERDRFEERLDKLQEVHREDAREQLRQAKEESRQREEAMLSREEARRKEAIKEARALREEVVELMEKAQKKEFETLSELFLMKKREVRSPKGRTERKYERKYAPHNDSEHKNELVHNNEQNCELPDTNQSKVSLGLEIPLDDEHNFELVHHNEHHIGLPDTNESRVGLGLGLPYNDDDIDDDNIEQISNVEYLYNDSDSDEPEINCEEEHNTEQQLPQGQVTEEREILILPSTSIITRPKPAPSADEIDAWSPAEVFRAVQEVIEKWKSLAEEVYCERSNSSVQNLHHIRRVMAENEMAFKPVLNICPNLPIIIAHMMVIHVGISVRTVSWTSKMTEWTEEVSCVIQNCPPCLFPRN